MSIWMLWKVFWTCFFTKLACWQISYVILEIAQDIQVGMDKGQHWQNARFVFEGCNFHALSFFFIFFPIYIEKDMDVSFLIALKSLRFNLSNSSSTQNINGRSNILIIFNLLCFESFIHKYLQNIKQKYQSVLCIKHR